MKSTKKILSLLLAMVIMVGAILVPNVAKAEEVKAEEKTLKVTLHKLVMTKDELDAWSSDDLEKKGYNATQNLADLQKLFTDQTLREIPGAYFAWQDADGKWIDKNGNVVTSVDEAYGALTGEQGFEFDTSELKNGTYKIVEVKEKSEYVGEDGKLLAESKAVPVELTLPVVNEKGVVANAHVYPKNTEEKPKVDKDFKDKAFTGSNDGDRNEIDEVESKTVGDKIPYEIKTEIPAKTQYKTAVWTDQMTEGLTFNDDIQVLINGVAAVRKDFEVTKDGNGFILSLTEAGLEKINHKDRPVNIVIYYSATLNEKAVVEVPERNDVQFHYGNYPTHGNTPKPNHPTDDGQLTATKTFDGDNWADDEVVTVTIKDAQTGKAVIFNDKQEATVNLTKNNNIITWTGLDKDREYIVEETFKKGDEVTYGIGEQGQITILNKKTKNPNPINPQEPGVVTYGHRFEKINQEGAGLGGAEFIIKNNIVGDDNNGKVLALKNEDQLAQDQIDYDAAEKAYKDAVKSATEETEEIRNLKATRDEAYKAVNTQWTWIDDTAEHEGAYKVISGPNGFFKVTGLQEGSYQLIETKAPDKYALQNGEIVFEVTNDSMGSTTINTDTDTQLTKIVNKLITIPQTGGIGSLIFIVAGLAIMGLAAFKIKSNKEVIR
ncbi:MAG: isopeptide-forming domain-containing fimbrial protein [Tissierellia bacterium]|nr:isopeptide-forming domain-containing fimbrial protein [Tissierellia bacterium]